MRGLRLIHFEQNTICQRVHTYAGHRGLRAPRPGSMDLCWFFFSLRSRLKVTLLRDSAWPLDSCCTLRSHWRPCCLSFLSRNLQMLPLPSRPPRAQPVNPHTPRTPPRRGGGVDIKMEEKKGEKKRIKEKMREAGTGCGAKRQKTI